MHCPSQHLRILKISNFNQILQVFLSNSSNFCLSIRNLCRLRHDGAEGLVCFFSREKVFESLLAVFYLQETAFLEICSP